MGRVLAETKVGKIHIVILKRPQGKVTYKTEEWIDTFGKDSGVEPSGKSAAMNVKGNSLKHLVRVARAYNRCLERLEDIYEDVVDKLVWHAEEMGVVYPLSTFSFQSSASAVR